MVRPIRAARWTSDGDAADGVAPGGGRPRLSIGLELGTAVTAVVGGVVLSARPDGCCFTHLWSHWQAVLSRLAPIGLLLATLVGGGFTAAGTWEWRRGRHARELSLDAGLGLACFELAELAWMGSRPLEAVYALVGVTVCVLAARPEA
jgi:hypothetical protein